MSNEFQPASDLTESTQQNQLSIAGMFWITTAVALVFGYAARMGQSSMLLALTYFGWVLLFGTITGAIRRDWKNAYFWGGLYALLAFLAVAGARIPHPAISLGWGAVGALVGSCVGVRLPRSFLLSVVVSSLMGWFAMGGVVLSMGQELTGHVGFDTLAAGFIGALLKPFTVLLQWFEKESRQPRFVLASWLAICVLVGNYLVPVVAGVQR